jgi:DNA phosphorothioation-associated putative methyltransferase
MTSAVARHRTAMSRNSLSRPLTQALTDKLLDADGDVFDYGCGRGDDLRNLAAMGIPAAGWDPVYRPSEERRQAVLVNLGYVINVIEDRTERADVLQRAWDLTQRTLVVSARLRWEARGVAGRPLHDGIITSTGTFQKFYEHAELGAWIEQTIGEAPFAAAPGIFYVFRDPADAQQLLAARVSAYRPRIRIDPQALYETHREVLTPVADFLAEHVRPPREDELTAAVVTSLRDVCGSLGRACQIIRKVASDDYWQEATDARRADLLVYIGLSRFGHRPRLSQLPVTLARDIKALFGTYQAACAQADRMLFAAGKTDLIDVAARSSRIGKRTPSAIYIHRSALPYLPPLLRLYEGCAQVLSGTVDGANLIKLSVASPQVSYLRYPRFDRDPHPVLSAAVTVSLNKLTVDFRDYSNSSNPPLLHRKEEFVPADYPHRELWERLTRAEVRAGLYEHPERIGTLHGWGAALDTSGVRLRGHKLVKTAAIAEILDAT